MDFVGDPDNDYVSCHILCSTSPRFPCMRGDLPAACSLSRATIQNPERTRDYE
jgi:hypothetical protein